MLVRAICYRCIITHTINDDLLLIQRQIALTVYEKFTYVNPYKKIMCFQGS